MRNRTSLVLIEVLIMLLVFALAAALCLRAFVWADTRSKQGQTRDCAVLTAERAAETLKHRDGDFAAAAADFGGLWDGEVWRVYYNEQWENAQSDAAFRLEAAPLPDDSAYLGRAEICVFDASGDCLSRLQLAWQEVGSDD